MKNKFKIGDNVYLTEYCRNRLGFDNNIEFTIIDILKLDVEFPIVLNSPQFGKDWIEFFNKDELIKKKIHVKQVK